MRPSLGFHQALRVMGVFLPVLISGLLFFGSAQARAECFKPLTDIKSKNPADWKDLSNFVPDLNSSDLRDVKSDEIIELQTIEKGEGEKINLDFYTISFAAHPSKTIREVFRDIRLNFPEFIKSQDQDFRPYMSTSEVDDKEFNRNKKLWDSVSPKGALMTFKLGNIPGIAASKERKISLKHKYGDVFATCSTDRDFIFSTVKTKVGKFHPVNGNRGFGIKDNGNSTWSFFLMGADRESPDKLGKLGARAIAKYVSFHQPELRRDFDEGVFVLGHKFWLEFFSGIRVYLEDNNMKPTPESFHANSERYSYPLPPNATD